MIEIMFGESEAGSMKMAKQRKDENDEEVICLGFLLDIGDIRESADSIYRKELIYSMYAQEQWGRDEEMDRELRETGNTYCREMERLLAYLQDGKPVRIWYSDAPYSACGFYHICNELQKYENDVFAVKLPDYIEKEDYTVIYSNWGEVPVEELMGFTSEERTLKKRDLLYYASLWQELREDNSPLRAVVNGRLTGVPENFYDFLIKKEITDQPQKEAVVIGNILGKHPGGVRDWWYAKRIDVMIEHGYIKVDEESENKYARMISRRCNIGPDKI